MAQVQRAYRRWIAIYLWNCGIPACDHTQLEFRRLNYCSIHALDTSVIAKFRELSLERSLELREIARLWVYAQPAVDTDAWFKKFDQADKQAQSSLGWILPHKKAA